MSRTHWFIQCLENSQISRAPRNCAVVNITSFTSGFDDNRCSKDTFRIP